MHHLLTQQINNWNKDNKLWNKNLNRSDVYLRSPLAAVNVWEPAAGCGKCDGCCSGGGGGVGSGTMSRCSKPVYGLRVGRLVGSQTSSPVQTSRQTGQQSHIYGTHSSAHSHKWTERIQAYQEGEATHVGPGEVVQLLAQVVHLLYWNTNMDFHINVTVNKTIVMVWLNQSTRCTWLFDRVTHCIFTSVTLGNPLKFHQCYWPHVDSASWLLQQW